MRRPRPTYGCKVYDDDDDDDDKINSKIKTEILTKSEDVKVGH